MIYIYIYISPSGLEGAPGLPHFLQRLGSGLGNAGVWKKCFWKMAGHKESGAVPGDVIEPRRIGCVLRRLHTA